MVIAGPDADVKAEAECGNGYFLPYAELLDGRVVKDNVLEVLRQRIAEKGLQPHLHVITVGDDAGSQVFVKQKRLAAEKTNIIFSQTNLKSEATLDDLRNVILKMNQDWRIDGIIVQLPLPEALQPYERSVLELVDPTKDVDCFHPYNFGLLSLGNPRFVPATPAGILRLLNHYNIETRGKRCVIVGKSNIVGKPLSLLLGHEHGPAATVILCDRHTENVWNLTKQADILIVAAGKHHLLADPSALPEHRQATVIDVGIHRVSGPGGKTVIQGDVDFEAVRHHCRWITPVPGGVGPMTVACLLEQVVEACSRRHGPLLEVRSIFQKYPWSSTKMHPHELLQVMMHLDPCFSKPALKPALHSAMHAMPTDDLGRINVEHFLRWVFEAEHVT